MYKDSIRAVVLVLLKEIIKHKLIFQTQSYNKHHQNIAIWIINLSLQFCWKQFIINLQMIVPIYTAKDYQLQLNYLPYRYRFKHIQKKMLPFARHTPSPTIKYHTHIKHHIRPAPLSYSEPPTSRESNNPAPSWGDEEEQIQDNSIYRKFTPQKEYQNAQLAAVSLRHRRVEEKREKILRREGQDCELYPYFESSDEEIRKEGKGANFLSNKNQYLETHSDPEENNQERLWQSSGWRAQDQWGLMGETEAQGKLKSEFFGLKLADTTIRSSLKVDQQEEAKYRNFRSDNTNSPLSGKGVQAITELLAKAQSLDNRHAQVPIKMKKQVQQRDASQNKYNLESKIFDNHNYPLQGALAENLEMNYYQSQLPTKRLQNSLWTPIRQKNVSWLHNEESPQDLAQKSGYTTKYNLYKELKASKEKELKRQKEQTAEKYTQKYQKLTSSQYQSENLQSINIMASKNYRKEKIQLTKNIKEDTIYQGQIIDPRDTPEQKHQEKTSKIHDIDKRCTNRSGFKVNDLKGCIQSLDEIQNCRNVSVENILQRPDKRDAQEGLNKWLIRKFDVEPTDLKECPDALERWQQRDELVSQHKRKQQAKYYTSPSKVDNDLERIWSFSDIISEDDIGLANSKKPASSRLNEENNFEEDESHSINMLRFSQPFKQLKSETTAHYAKYESGQLEERRSEVKSCEQEHLLKMIGGSDNLKQLSSLRLDSNQSGAWNEQALKEELSYFLKTNRLPQQSHISLSQQPSPSSSTFHFEHHEVDFNLMEALRNHGLTEQRRRQQESQDQQHTIKGQNGWAQQNRGFYSDFIKKEQVASLGNEDVQEEVLFGAQLNRDSKIYNKEMVIIQESEENCFPSTSTSMAQLTGRSISDYRHHFHPMRQAISKFKQSTSRSISSKSKQSLVQGYPQGRHQKGPVLRWNRTTGEIQREKTRKQINLTRFKTRINNF